MAAHDGHPATGLGQSLRNRQTDPAAAAGDQSRQPSQTLPILTLTSHIQARLSMRMARGQDKVQALFRPLCLPNYFKIKVVFPEGKDYPPRTATDPQA